MSWQERGYTYRVESFFTMLRKDTTTPYTSLASSSNGRPPCDWDVVDACTGTGFVDSLSATTIPVVDDSVFLGLLKAVLDAVSIAVLRGCDTAWDTAARIPPSPAGFGFLDRCQS